MVKVWEWRAMAGGKVLHAVRRNSDGRLSQLAACGRTPTWFKPDGWFVQADLRRCRACVSKGAGGW